MKICAILIAGVVLATGFSLGTAPAEAKRPNYCFAHTPSGMDQSVQETVIRLITTYHRLRRAPTSRPALSAREREVQAREPLEMIQRCNPQEWHGLPYDLWMEATHIIERRI